MNDNTLLRYADATERTYGVAGMALMLAVTEEMPPFDTVSIDAPAGEAICLDEAYMHAGSTVATVATVYRALLRRYTIYMRMAISNVMARRYVLHHTGLAADVRAALYNMISVHGSDECQLENDEIRALFTEEYQSMNRIFNHPQVSGLVKALADTLTARRTLTRREVVEMLR